MTVNCCSDGCLIMDGETTEKITEYHHALINFSLTNTVDQLSLCFAWKGKMSYNFIFSIVQVFLNFFLRASNESNC